MALPLHFLGLSIMCKTTICPKAFNASPPHGLHQCHQIPLRYGIPLLLQKLEDLSSVYCWQIVVMNTAAQDVPEVLSWCHVRRTGWPVHPGNLMLLQEGGHHPSAEGSGVVVLKNSARSHGLQCGENKASYDLISVPHASQIALHEVKRGPAVKMDASPYHQRPSFMTIGLANTSISKALFWTPPDALSGIIVAETVPRFICE